MPRIRRYCGPYVFEMERDYIREYCGPIIYEIDGNRLRRYCGSYIYEADGFMSEKDWKVFIMILHG